MTATGLRYPLWWLRQPQNPVLPPLPASDSECGCCMNPFVLRRDDHYHLYYAGADADGHRRICLATAPVANPTAWQRRGVVLDRGAAGAFDYNWVVLPHVVEINGRWHLYYTGNAGRGEGLAAFPGIGLAISNDGRHFERHGDAPVLAPGGKPGDPDRYGIAGGSVLPVATGNGVEWWFYYTGCPSLGDDVFRNQQKICCLAVSTDGIAWHKRGAVMYRMPEREYVDVAAAGPVVRQREDGTFSMFYSAIGTRWGYYSICYAESDDGIVWHRGEQAGDDLTLGPSGQGWERQMVEYPTVIEEGARTRLFYCGNGYGSTGIGTAVSCPLRALARPGPSQLRIVAPATGHSWTYRMPEAVDCSEGMFKSHALPLVDWHGPNADGVLWHEWQTNEADRQASAAATKRQGRDIPFVLGLHYRVMVRHVEDGLEIVFTATNTSDRPLLNITAFPCLGFPHPDFQDPELTRTFIEVDGDLVAMCETDRGSGDPVRTHYHLDGQAPRTGFGLDFWGAASATVASSGAILRTSADGRWSIAAAWERVAEIYQNEDAHHCLHSVPAIGDLEPGDSRTVKGRIVFVAGPAEAARELLRY